MTDRRPSGFRMDRQPPPTGHYAPETEAYHHRQNVYFRVWVWIAIGVTVGVLILVMIARPSDPDGAYENQFIRRSAGVTPHEEKHSALPIDEWRAHILEGPHGDRP